MILLESGLHWLYCVIYCLIMCVVKYIQYSIREQEKSSYDVCICICTAFRRYVNSWEISKHRPNKKSKRLRWVKRCGRAWMPEHPAASLSLILPLFVKSASLSLLLLLLLLLLFCSSWPHRSTPRPISLPETTSVVPIHCSFLLPVYQKTQELLHTVFSRFILCCECVNMTEKTTHLL